MIWCSISELKCTPSQKYAIYNIYIDKLFLFEIFCRIQFVGWVCIPDTFRKSVKKWNLKFSSYLVS